MTRATRSAQAASAGGFGTLGRLRGAMAVFLALLFATSAATLGQVAAAATPTGPAWSTLTPAQQKTLEPLRPTWDSIDAPRKKKWIEVAERFPQMPAEERRRVQERMAAWAAMSPAERAQARLQFQETRRIGAEERQSRWQAYQSLPEEERKRLAETASKRNATANGATAGAAPAHIAAKPAPAARAAAKPGGAASGAAFASTGAKRNVVTAAPGPAPRSVAPTVVQAKPGATTTTVATRAKPPLHHQPGLPKIVATPAFVDPTTLLPRRGPQAAAMRAAASSDPTEQP